MKSRNDSQVRRFHINRGSIQTRFAELINDRIFNPSGAKLGISNVCTASRKIDH
jgi:hypothetical protein